MKDISFAKKFVRELLEKEFWFSVIKKNNDVDLIILAGSTITGNNDKYSDFDLFLICSRENQIKYSLKPIYEYLFHKIRVEVSIVSREKLINDRYNKDNLYWWYNCKIIKGYNKNLLRYFNEASTINKEELRDRLWTKWVRFEINTGSILTLVKREEPLGAIILFSENIKLVVDSVLTINHVFVHYKQQGLSIKNIDGLLYQDLQKMNNLASTKELIKCNYLLRKRLFLLFKKYGFKNNELNNWSNYHLSWLTFQYM